MACASAILTAGAGVNAPPGTAERSAVFDVGLTASVQPAPGALLTQFLANQVQNCSLICPFVVQGAVQIPASVLAAPATLVTRLRAGQPVVQALGLTGATVSGTANEIWTGLIRTDLDQVVPRTQFGTEVIAVGLVRIGEAAITQPGGLPGALGQVRSDLFGALNNPPGPEPLPAVHTPLEAAAVRGTEVFWAVAFHGPEQLTLIVTRVPNAFLTTLGSTGNVGKAVQAAGEAAATTISESVAPVRDALTKPIPITPATAAKDEGKAPDVTAAHPRAPAASVERVKTMAPQAKTPVVRLDPKSNRQASWPRPPALSWRPDPGSAAKIKQPNPMSGLGGAIKKAFGDVGAKKPAAPGKPAKTDRP